MTSATPPQQSDAPPTKATPDGKSYHGSVADGNLAHSMELRDFLDRLGLIMRLPKKRKPKPEDAGAAGAIQIPWRKVLVVGAVAAIVVTASQVMSGMQKTKVDVPDQFLGSWRTDNKKYATRGFRISETQIELAAGQRGLPKIRPIEAVTTREAHDTTYLTIQYLEDNRMVEWPIALIPAAQPTIRFVHQPEIDWVRASSSR
jgi:hypothetical protein